MEQCNICDKEFEKLSSLRKHYGRTHSISSQEFYDEFVLDGKRPTCKCGCGEEVTYLSFKKGYREWVKGHIARVENNWGHNPEAIEKSAETRRQQYANGEREPWNKGLTVEDHPSIKKYGRSVSEAFTDDRKKEYSKRMRDMRLNDPRFETKYGKEAPGWKGGTSTINTLVRNNRRLYKEWKFPILKEQNFECQACGNTKKLEVHHNDETMANILNKLIDDISDYTWEQKQDLMNEVIDYHIDQNVKGEVLCKECHMKLHPSYNL